MRMQKHNFKAFDADTADALMGAAEDISKLHDAHEAGIKAIQTRLQNMLQGRIIIWDNGRGGKIRGRVEGIVEWAGMFHLNVWSIPKRPRYEGDSHNYHVWLNYVISVE